MNRVVVPSAVQLAGASKEVVEVSTGQREKCTQQFAPNVVPILWYPLDPAVTGQSTVAIASAG